MSATDGRIKSPARRYHTPVHQKPDNPSVPLPRRQIQRCSSVFLPSVIRGSIEEECYHITIPSLRSNHYWRNDPWPRSTMNTTPCLHQHLHNTQFPPVRSASQKRQRLASPISGDHRILQCQPHVLEILDVHRGSQVQEETHGRLVSALGSQCQRRCPLVTIHLIEVNRIAPTRGPRNRAWCI
ncbi:hypothetical protein BJX65DRAFT_270604 [Aspergillus insuetus]